jgi:hypothetical protein
MIWNTERQVITESPLTRAFLCLGFMRGARHIEIQLFLIILLFKSARYEFLCNNAPRNEGKG